MQVAGPAASTEIPSGEAEAPSKAHPAIPPGPSEERRTFMDKAEAFISRLSTRNNFWHRVCSLIFLPYAFRSGIRMKRLDEKTFAAVLPFRRFNRNWYNAMAGAALLGNAEIAGGMFVFGSAGGDYTVVCKELQYRFLRPCFGPAMYKIRSHDDIETLVATEKEFDVTLTMDVVQQLKKPGQKDKRVGRVTVTFHATPKQHQKQKGRFKPGGKVQHDE
ncbi:MAG: hypothetical protein EA378_09440 [Phycisphaerales bacterium]|nr:MAG: hypothetical protein EA378_09440 [Phycisphaerales bacterium]